MKRFARIYSTKPNPELVSIVRKDRLWRTRGVGDMRIAVVGGGISGLATSYALERRVGTDGALTIDLFEADSRLRGVIDTVRFGPAVIEMGPDSLVDKPEGVVQLARQLGLGGDLAPINPGPPLWLKADGWHPFPHRETRSYTLTSGLDQLPESLARSLRSTHINLGAEVQSISPRGRQWMVIAHHGIVGLYDAVVLALPTVRAVSLLAERDWDTAFRQVAYPARAVVGAVYPGQALHDTTLMACTGSVA